MAWVILVFAGVLEVAWATGLKYTEGFTNTQGVPPAFGGALG